MKAPKIKRAAAAAALGSCLAVGACTNSSPPADAYVSLVMTGSQTPGSACEYSAGVNILQIGMPVAFNRISDGAPGVQVSCRVSPAPGGFTFSLSASKSGGNAASVTFSTPTGVVTASGGQMIEADIVTATGAIFSSTGCLLTFSGPGAVPNPPIDKTRIWGHISCPAVKRSDVPTDTCDAEADVIFENCGG